MSIKAQISCLIRGKKSWNFITDHFKLELTPVITDSNLEHARGVIVWSSGFVIQYPGLYNVYSSLAVQNSPEENKWSTAPLAYYVTRSSPNSPMYSGVLLRSVQTKCISCSQHQKALFSGGVFQLVRGDIIKLSLARPSMVKADT
ncbi:unnamed protein product, partial [Lymnaea stagnalis]